MLFSDCLCAWITNSDQSEELQIANFRVPPIAMCNRDCAITCSTHFNMLSAKEFCTSVLLRVPLPSAFGWHAACAKE